LLAARIGRGGFELGLDRFGDVFMNRSGSGLGEGEHFGIDFAAGLEAHGATEAIGLAPGMFDVAAELLVDAVALHLPLRGKDDFAVHFGDEIETRDPRIELSIAKATAKRFAHVGPDGRRAFAFSSSRSRRTFTGGNSRVGGFGSAHRSASGFGCKSCRAL